MKPAIPYHRAAGPDDAARLHLVEETDGSGKEEGEPDARYRRERGTPA